MADRVAFPGSCSDKCNASNHLAIILLGFPRDNANTSGKPVGAASTPSRVISLFESRLQWGFEKIYY